MRYVYILSLFLNGFLTTRYCTDHHALHPILHDHYGIMSFFRITLIRSAIGLPRRTQGVLSALGLRKRMRTVFHPVSPQVAGQIMKVKELVAVSEVEKALTSAELREMRKPDPGYYIERPVANLEEEGI